LRYGSHFGIEYRTAVNRSVTEGCDTVRTLVLNVEPLLTDFEELTVCENQLPYTWYGHVFSGDSTLVDTVASVTEGCDTVRTLVLNTEPLLTDFEELTVCENELPYTWYGHIFSGDSTLVDTVASVTEGCDTVRTLSFYVVPENLDYHELTVCENELPYIWYGHTFSSDSILVETIASTTGDCDTIRTLVLNVIPEVFDFDELTVCENELPYTWYGHIFSGDSTLVDTIPSASGGCDTLRTLVLNVVPLIEVLEQLTICESELPYIWFGNTFTSADTIVRTVPSTTGGCDTIRTLELQTLPDIEVLEQLTICCHTFGSVIPSPRQTPLSRPYHQLRAAAIQSVRWNCKLYRILKCSNS